MSELIGKTLGPYRILEQIGVGGMATVYKAYQPSMDRYVAVKILPHYLSTQDEQFLKRFQREARAIAKLEHAHILPVYDYGEHENIPYLTMRYVEAGTLKERIAKGALSLDEINHIIGQVGGALDYAHRLGVIHRDVKPGNVLIDNQGNTFLTDFGLARMLEASQHLTASGVGVGTPAYMSPEQSQGDKVDHRSDIYSLGVILYEMVTGRVPYEAETPMAVMLKHITDPLPLPRIVAPTVPESVELVILKALAKDPAARYQTAGEMVQALAAAIRKVENAETQRPAVTSLSEPTREDVSLITRVQKLWEQPRGKVGLIGGAVVGVILLGWLLSQIRGNITIVGPGATSTSAGGDGTLVGLVASATLAPTNPAEPTRTPRPTQTARPTATAGPTSTPNPLALGETLTVSNGDISICKQGNCTPTGLSSTYTNFEPSHLSWSPDGSSFTFTACTLEFVLNNPGARCPKGTYVVRRDVSSTLRVSYDPGDTHRNPSWSPDGNWIAFSPACNLSVVHPDGTGQRVLIPYIGINCPYAIAWSPDSQRIAWIGGGGCCEPSRQYVWVANSDGNGAKIVFYSSEFELAETIAWDPDGNSVAVTLWTGKSYLIDADCQGGATGCDETSRTELVDIPQDWQHNFHPQWISTTEVAHTLSPQAEQARAFAEPILAAIKDRTPDFEDDFSTANKGWKFGFGQNGNEGTMGIEDGVARLRLGIADAYFVHEALNHKDFVLQVDARLASGDKASQMQVFFHMLSSDYWFKVNLYSGLGAWDVTKMWAGRDAQLASGEDGINPLGETTQVTIVARGSRAAIYFNGAPVAYFEDADFDTSGKTLLMCASTSQTVCEFDNVKFWNLDNVPGLP